MAINSVTTSNYYLQTALNSPVSVSVALAALKINPIAKIQISDTTANINNNLDTLTKYANNLTQIGFNDPQGTSNSGVLNMTNTQFNSYVKLLPKIATGYQLNIADADASSAATLVADSRVASVSVKDSSANVNLRLDALSTATNKSKISKIVLTTPATPLTLTAAQYTSSAFGLSKLTGSYSLAITGANVTTAIGYAQNQSIKTISVEDTAQNISNNLDGLVQLGLRLKEVKGTNSNVYDVNASQIQPDSLVIGKLYNGYQLNVHGADMNMTQLLFSNKKAIKIDVVDTAANISSRIALLGSMGSTLNSIHVTDAATKSLSLTSDQFGQYTGVLAKILSTDAYKVAVSQATAAEAQTLSTNTLVSGITVADSAQGISVAIDDLNANTKVTGISISTSNQALRLSYAQLSSDTVALGKIQSNYALNVTNATASNAVALSNSNPRASSIEVVDTSANVLTAIDNLAAMGSRLAKVTESDNTALTLTQSRWIGLQGALGKIDGGYNVKLTEVKAADAKSLALDSRVLTVAVKDTAKAISSNLDALNSLGTQLTSLAPSDGSVLTITADQLNNDTAALASLASTINYKVTGVPVSQLTTLSTNTRVTSISISDTSDNIASNLDAIQAAVTSLGAKVPPVTITITQSGTVNPLNLTAAQVSSDAGALAAITGNYALKVSAVAAANAVALASNTHVSSMEVKDTATAIKNQIGSLSNLGSKVYLVTQTDPANNLELTLPQWTSNATFLRKFQNGLHVNLNGVTTAQALTLVADSRVDHVSVTDTAAQVSSKLDTLQALGPKLTTVTLSDVDTNPVKLTMAQMTADQSVIQKLAGAYKLNVSSASAADAQTLSTNANVTAISVSDGSDNLSAQLDNLSANTKVSTILVSDSKQPIPITVAQITNDATALSKIVGAYSLNVTNAAAINVATLIANTKVVTMQITDTTANVQSKIADIVANGPKIGSLSMTDGPSELSLTYAQWVAGQTSLSKISSSFQVNLTGVSAANAAQLAADDRVKSIAVVDTSAHVQNNLDALAGVNPKILSVTLSDASPPATMTITAKQYSNDATILAKIPSASYNLNVTSANVDQAQALFSDASVLKISVVDTSDNLASHLSDLNSNTKLLTITNTTPTVDMQITGAMYTASATTLGKINSYLLSVTDALASKTTDLESNVHVDNYSISDTSTAISQVLNALVGLSSKLLRLTVTSDNGPFALTQAQLNNFTGSNNLIKTLAKVQGNYSLSLSGVTTNNLNLLSSPNLVLTPGEQDPFTISTSKITSIAIADTSQNISLAFDQLINLGSRVSSLTLSVNTAPIALTPTQLSNGSDLLSSVTGSVYHLALLNAHVDDVLSLSASSVWTNNIDSVGIFDNANTISSAFDQLQPFDSKIQTINASNYATIYLTAAQYGTNLASKIMSSKNTVQ